MNGSELDRWTKRIVRGISSELQASPGGRAGDSRLLADLSRQVRETLAREFDAPARPAAGVGIPSGLVNEITLAVYLQLAAHETGPELTPELLLTLNRRLSRDLAFLNGDQQATKSLGGTTMKSAVIAFGALLLAHLWMPPRLEATPEFAKQWTSSCASCHVGAPPGLDEEGIAFRLAGYDQAMEAPNPRPKLFLSLVTDLVSFSRTEGRSEEMTAPESASLFSLVRLDRAGKVKAFAIGELRDENGEVQLDFAHGHLQINPLNERENLNIRLGNVEPVTRLWNSDMRRLFETPLWGGVDTRTGEADTAAGGGHHAHGGTGDSLSVLPASDWGGDVSTVIGRNWLIGGGYAGETAFAGVFFKRGGRAFDNSTYARGLQYDQLGDDEKSAFSAQQVKLAKKWERSMIFGLSAYTGSGNRNVFDGSLFSGLEAEHGEEGEHGEGEEDHGDDGDGDHDDGDGDHDDGDGDHDDGDGDHDGDGDGDHDGDGDGDHDDDGDGDHDDDGDEGDHGEGDHGDEGEHTESFLPMRLTGTSRLVGEIKTRWDRFGVYVIGVLGTNDYALGHADAWAATGQFVRDREQSYDFSAWAAEGSMRVKVTPTLTGRVALRYEELSPEDDQAARSRRAVATLAIPIRMMRPALWPYLEVSQDYTRNEWTARGGVRLGY